MATLVPQPFARPALAGVGCVLVLAACGSAPQPTALPPQTMTGPATEAAPPEEVALRSPEEAQAAPTTPPPSAPTPRTQEAPAEAPREDSSTIVVTGNPAKSGDPRAQLRAAAERERARRARSKAPVATITDENLSEMAEGARVTIGSAPQLDTEEREALALSEEMKEQEIYWRTRAREVRQEWREAYDQIGELEQRAEELRTRFYAEDDPVRRDREVKPAWDRALDLLDEARRGVERAKTKLAALQDEGRRAGALPGWLREGTEIQPPELEEPEPAEAKSSEPEIIKN